MKKFLSLDSAKCLSQIDEVLQNTLDSTEAIQKIVDIVFETFECDRAYMIYPCDPYAPTWTPIERSKDEYIGVTDICDELLMDQSMISTCEVLLEHKDVVTFGPQEQYPVPKALSETFDIQSRMSMPLFPPESRAWNFGIHQCSFARIWSNEEIALFRTIGLRITNALPPRS